MKKIVRVIISAVLVGLLAGPQFTPIVFGAASGNYTDLLPVGAAGNTTVISNGSGWGLTTLAPSQTFGDALSRTPMTVYQSTGLATIQATTAVSTFSSVAAGSVGSATFPAAWVASGRTIRVTLSGRYSTAGTPTWNWGLKIGTMTVLQTGALNAPTAVSSQTFTATALMTIFATGSAGSVSANYNIFTTTGAFSGTATSNMVSYSTSTASPTTIDFNSQSVVNPTFTWGAAASAIQANNILIEFLN